MSMERNGKWLDWAVELQALAQAGLAYGQNAFDRERYARIRDIAAEMLAYKTDIPLEKVKDLFCGESGYQTPKLDTRSAVFQDGKILLVRELDGLWALPGGWVDVGLTVGENAVKEVREEAGMDVALDFLIAVQDRDRHNRPVYAHKICKVFFMCTLLGGAFRENTETTACGWFARDELPPLAETKTTAEQVEMCFAARGAEHWTALFE